MNYSQLRENQERLGIVHFIENGIEVQIDLNQVASSTSRIGEIAFITKLTAPELCEALGRAHRSLDVIVNRVKAAKNDAKAALERTYAYLRLHEARTKLRELEIKETDANIDAHIKLDEQYIDGLDFFNYLNWVIEDLESRREEVRRAHATARGIAGAVELSRGNFSVNNSETTKNTFGKPTY